MNINFAKLGLALASGLFSLVVVELYLWIFPSVQDALVLHLAWSELPAGFYEPLPQELKPGERPKATSYTHRRNTSGRFKALEYDVMVRSNSLGFRGPEPTSEQQVLLLGDSFVFGAQVPIEETFAAQLDDRFPELSILNAGVSGYGTYESIQLWSRMKDSLSVQQAVLFLFWGNDLRDNQKYVDSEVMKEPRDNLLPLFPARYSRLYGRVYLLLATEDSRLEEKRNQMRILHEQPQREAILPATQMALTLFEKECLLQQIRCTVALLPPVEAFSDSLMADSVVRDIREIIPSGLRMVDLYTGLKSKGGQELFFKYDPHWNSSGHKAVTEILVDDEIIH